jgi:hypothetical protein
LHKVWRTLGGEEGMTKYNMNELEQMAKYVASAGICPAFLRGHTEITDRTVRLNERAAIGRALLAIELGRPPFAAMFALDDVVNGALGIETDNDRRELERLQIDRAALAKAFKRACEERDRAKASEKESLDDAMSWAVAAMERAKELEFRNRDLYEHRDRLVKNCVDIHNALFDKDNHFREWAVAAMERAGHLDALLRARRRRCDRAEESLATLQREAKSWDEMLDEEIGQRKEKQERIAQLESLLRKRVAQVEALSRTCQHGACSMACCPAHRDGGAQTSVAIRAGNPLSTAPKAWEVEP